MVGPIGDRLPDPPARGFPLRRSRVPKPPFPSAYWVEPGKLLAGEYPGARSARTARGKIKSLMACGIREVINLMESDELDLYGRPFVPYEPLFNQLATPSNEVFCRRFSIRDMDVPDEVGMRAILDAIDAALDARRPVYVHCLAGVGRTGTVVGCWLVRHGRATGANVIDIIKALRQHDPHAHWPSPQSHVQRHMVRHWWRGR